MIKVIPDLPHAKAHYIHRAMDILDYIMVPMSDGQVVRYVPDVEHPSLLKIRENMKKLNELCVGYPADGEETE